MKNQISGHDTQHNKDVNYIVLVKVSCIPKSKKATQEKTTI